MKKYLPGLVIFVALLSSCIGRPAGVKDTSVNDSKPGDPEQPPAKVGVALIDATGSYTELIPALKRLQRFAGEELNQGDTFCAFWIKSGIGDSVDFLVEPVTLPVAKRRIGDPAEVNALAMRQEIQKTFASYANARTFKKAGQTDLLQSISYGGRLLAAEDKSRERWMLLFTDLEDNQTKTADLRLKGVHVRVFYVPARNDLNGLDRKISDWKQRFEKAGAVTVEIYDVGQSESLSRLLDR